TTGDQDQIAAGDGALRDVKERLRQPDDPYNGKQQQDAHTHRGQKSHPPRRTLLRSRELAREDRNEDDIVDAEHNLKERQRDEREQTGGSEECVHSAALRWSLSCILRARLAAFNVAQLALFERKRVLPG